MTRRQLRPPQNQHTPPQVSSDHLKPAQTSPTPQNQQNPVQGSSAPRDTREAAGLGGLSGVCPPTPTVPTRQDERNQVLTSYLWVRQAWLDAHLTWDKDAYGGIDSIRIPSSYVWRPDIILYNKWVVLAPPTPKTLLPEQGGAQVGAGKGMGGVANVAATRLHVGWEQGGLVWGAERL